MLKNMRIGRMVSLFFAIVTILFLIASSILMYYLLSNNKTSEEGLHYQGFSQGAIANAWAEFQSQRATIRDIIFLTDADELKEVQNNLAESTTKLTNYLDILHSTYCQTDKDRQTVKQIQEQLVEYRAISEDVVTLGIANLNREALNLFRTEAEPILTEISSEIEGFLQAKVAEGNGVLTIMQENAKSSVMLSILVLIIATAITIVVTIVVSRSIGLPTKEIANAVTRMKQGYLDVSIEYESTNEMGILAESLKELIQYLKEIVSDMSYVLGEIAKGNMTVSSNMSYRGDFVQIGDAIKTISTSLNETIYKINEVSEQVAGRSDQLAADARMISQGASEQASSIEELSTSIQNISENIKMNAKNSGNVDRIFTETNREMKKGNEKMKEMVDAMNQIRSDSQRIIKIIKAIDDIAFQTNILALNAAVEAARAGEAGKGFAVVADEVRNLAGKSAEAAHNTTDLIESAIQTIENGVKIAYDTADSLGYIVEGVNESADLISNITKASVEQAGSISQVNENVQQISIVVQTNSSAAAESVAASEHLSDQVQILKGLVQMFQILEGDGSKPFESEKDKQLLTQATMKKEIVDNTIKDPSSKKVEALSSRGLDTNKFSPEQKCSRKNDESQSMKKSDKIAAVKEKHVEKRASKSERSKEDNHPEPKLHTNSTSETKPAYAEQLVYNTIKEPDTIGLKIETYDADNLDSPIDLDFGLSQNDKY